MKTVITTVAMTIFLAASVEASVINVGGTRVKIANKYNKHYVEVYANRCLADRLNHLQTDAAVRLAAVVCTNEVLSNDYPQELPKNNWQNQNGPKRPTE
jgi:hypothetical protein